MKPLERRRLEKSMLSFQRYPFDANILEIHFKEKQNVIKPVFRGSISIRSHIDTTRSR